jgi:hypothetical protein
MSSPTTVRERVTLGAVLAVWLAMSVLAWVFVARYASPVPFMDDSELLLGLVPEAKLDWTFWWVPANEHRILIPRVLYMSLLALTHDFRSAMYLEVVLQSALALALLLFARRLRGRASLADAFFPLLLLHWGNAANFLLGMQITIAVPTVLTCTFLMLGLARPAAPSPRAALGMVACAFLLPLNGGFGLTQLPPLLAWMLALGVLLVRAPEAERRRSGRVLLGGVALCLALVVAYFWNFEFPESTSKTHAPLAVLRTALQFLSLNFGPVATRFRILAPIVAVGFAAVAALFALRAARESRTERWRVALVLAGLAAACTIALAVGMSRTEMGYSAGLATRYVILPAPFFVAAYLGLCLYGPRLWAGVVQAIGCLLLIAALPTELHARPSAWAWPTWARPTSMSRVDRARHADPEAVVMQNWKAFYPSPEGFPPAPAAVAPRRTYPPFGTIRRWPRPVSAAQRASTSCSVSAARAAVRDTAAVPRRILQEKRAAAARADSEVVLTAAARRATGCGRASASCPTPGNGALGREQAHGRAGLRRSSVARRPDAARTTASSRELWRQGASGPRSALWTAACRSLELDLPQGPRPSSVLRNAQRPSGLHPGGST